MIKYDVFISFSSTDRKITEGICGFLEARGIRCFVSYRDIPTGVDWAACIADAIDLSNMMVVVFSKDFKNSKQTNREIGLAAEKPIPILTYRIANEQFAGAMKYYLSSLNWIDAFPDAERCFGELYENVCKLLERNPNHNVTVANNDSMENKIPNNDLLTDATIIDVHIESDADCNLYIYDKLSTQLNANSDNVVNLNPGTYKLTFISLQCPDVRLTKIYSFSSKSFSELIKIELKEQIDNRIKTEQEENKKEELNKRILNPVIQRGKYVFADETGKVIFNIPWNRYARGFHEGLAAVKGENDKYGYIDKAGRLIIPHMWEDADFFYEGLAGVKNDEGKWGFINEKGEIVVPFKWKSVWHYSEGLARVEDHNENSGFIDKKGELVIPNQWKWIWKPGITSDQKNWWIFHNGYALVSDRNGKYGFIDKTGKLAIPCQWKDAMPFRNGTALVMDSNGLYGYLDESGDMLTPCKWKSAESFQEGLALVQDCYGQYGFLDPNGKLVIPCTWNNAWNFNEGLAKVELRGKWSFIDKTGNCVFNNQWWKRVSVFSEGLAGVMDFSGKWGFIDKSGKVIIPYKWEDVWYFKGGLCRVSASGLNHFYEHYIDKSGKLIW